MPLVFAIKFVVMESEYMLNVMMEIKMIVMDAQMIVSLTLIKDSPVT
jgi:hypothetical protein